MKSSSSYLAFLATIVQFYDYALFGLSAGILSEYFMPQGSNETKLFHFFGIYALSVLARPIGSLIFGYIGDRYSRSNSIKFASLIAMIATFSIALIPSFDQIGVFSTILLMLSRMLFLISQGGEVDLTRIYIVEKLTKCKNLANGAISFCTQLGSLLAASAYYIALEYNDGYIWKINFMLGGVGGLIVLLMRNSMEESALFKRYKSDKFTTLTAKSENLIDIINTNKFNFIITIFAHGALGGAYNFLIIFLNIFAATNSEILSLDEARKMNIVLIICFGIFAVISGYIADKIRPYWQICASIILTYASYMSLISEVSQLPYINIIFVIFMALYSVPLHVILQSLFKTEHKSRLYSLAHSIGGVLFSSSTPFISMLIWKKTSSINAVLSIYFGIITVIFAIMLLLKMRNNNTGNKTIYDKHKVKIKK